MHALITLNISNITHEGLLWFRDRELLIDIRRFPHPVLTVRCFPVLPTWIDQQVVLTKQVEESISAKLDIPAFQIILKQVMKLTCADLRQRAAPCFHLLNYRFKYQASRFISLLFLVNSLPGYTQQAAASGQAYSSLDLR